MAKTFLNEAEHLLVKQWAEARLLEKSLERIRKKYSVLYEQAAEAIMQTHEALDSQKVHVRQFWSQGTIAIGKKSWPEGNDYNMPGLWLDHVRLEVLSDDEKPQPFAFIWIPPKALKAAGQTLAQARAVVLSASAELLTSEEQAKVISPQNAGKAIIGFNAPTKKELLELLLAGDGDAFVNTIVNTFEIMVRFVDVLDDLFKK